MLIRVDLYGTKMTAETKEYLKTPVESRIKALYFSSELCLAFGILIFLIVNIGDTFNPLFPGLYSAALWARRAYLVLWVLPVIVKEAARRPLPVLLFVAIVVLLFTLNEMFAPVLYSEVSDILKTFLAYCMPLAIVAGFVRSYELLYDYLVKMCPVVFAAAFVILVSCVLFNVQSAMSSVYSMGLGYSLLPFLLVVVNQFFHVGDDVPRLFCQLIMATTMLAVVVIVGSRGPLLCFAVFLALKIFRWIIHGRKEALGLIVLLGVVFLLSSYDFALIVFARFLSAIGSSRTGRLLEEYVETGDIHLSGRDDLQGPLLDEIASDPFMARGIGADRELVGTYAHNIVIETTYSFGLIVGAIVIIILALYLIKVLSKSGIRGELCLVLFCVSVPELLISSTLWANQIFWIGLVLAFVPPKDERKESSFTGLSPERDSAGPADDTVCGRLADVTRG